MGLDISCANNGFRAGSYTGFGNYKTYLAKLVSDNKTLCKINFLSKKEEDWYDSDKLPKEYDGLKIILEHSDCDGTISPNEAEILLGALKRSLKKIKEVWEDKNKQFIACIKGMQLTQEDYDWMIEKTKNWINICKISIKTKEDIIFG